MKNVLTGLMAIDSKTFIPKWKDFCWKIINDNTVVLGDEKGVYVKFCYNMEEAGIERCLIKNADYQYATIKYSLKEENEVAKLIRQLIMEIIKDEHKTTLYIQSNFENMI